MRRFHAIAAVVWMLLLIPGLLAWPNSVLFVMLCSVYANIVGHVSSWQAARAEAAADN